MIKVTYGSQSLNTLKPSHYVNKKNSSPKVDPQKEKIKAKINSIIDDAASVIRKYRDQEKVENGKRMNEVIDCVEGLLGKKPEQKSDNSISVDGVEFTSEEMANAVTVLKSAEGSIKSSITDSKLLDYVNYGHFEIARNIVEKYTRKNLNAEQGELINKALNGFIDKAQEQHDSIIRKYFEKTTDDFYAYKVSETAQMDDLATVTEDKVVASNLELIKKITTLFSTVEFSDTLSVATAIAEYKKIVSSAYREVTEDTEKLEDKLNYDTLSLGKTITSILAAAKGMNHVSDKV